MPILGGFLLFCHLALPPGAWWTLGNHQGFACCSALSTCVRRWWVWPWVALPPGAESFPGLGQMPLPSGGSAPCRAFSLLVAGPCVAGAGTCPGGHCTPDPGALPRLGSPSSATARAQGAPTVRGISAFLLTCRCFFWSSGLLSESWGWLGRPAPAPALGNASLGSTSDFTFAFKSLTHLCFALA